MQRLLPVSHTPTEQSELRWQAATATHLLPKQSWPLGQSVSATHWTHAPRVVSQMRPPVHSALVAPVVNVTHWLPRQ